MPSQEPLHAGPSDVTKVARPALKVAGARISGDTKGKQRPALKRSGGVADLMQPPAKKPHGRSAGAANYSLEDVDALLTILEDSLPLGGKAWEAAAKEHAQWAESHGRPSRTAKSLELKFKQVRLSSYSMKHILTLDLACSYYQAHGK